MIDCVNTLSQDCESESYICYKSPQIEAQTLRQDEIQLGFQLGVAPCDHRGGQLVQQSWYVHKLEFVLPLLRRTQLVDNIALQCTMDGMKQS